MADNEKIILTESGFNDLKAELAERTTTIRADISERIKEAKAQGDLSENSEYDEAREAQGKNEGRIQEIEHILRHSEVIADEDISKTEISLGSVFKLRDEETKEEEQYVLVTATEEDIFANKISEQSPLGQAILGKKKGNVVEVPTSYGTYKYKITKIGL